MKRYKLKDEVVAMLMAIGFIIIMVGLGFVIADRTNKIDNGTMVVIDHNAGDR